MGQDISFTQVESGNESTHIYSLNRSLTGMEIISYTDSEFNVDKNNGADILAKQLLDLGVDSVSIYSNVVSINCESARYKEIKDDIEDRLVNIFRFYDDKTA